MNQGALCVEGLLVRCTSADCGSSDVLGSIVDLGMTTVGSSHLLRMDWDMANKRFRFRRDSDPFAYATYTVSDALPPVLAFKSLQTRTLLANC